MNWIDIGALDDIPVRGGRLVKTEVGCVALFRTGADEVFAASDACPHAGGPLSEGIVHGRRVTCPLHNLVIDLETGVPEGGAYGSIPTYEVRIENGRLLLEASALGRRAAA